MSAFQWSAPPDQAFLAAYDTWLRDLIAALRLLCQRYAAEIETWMKANAVWTDRTGNLRQSMYTLLEELGSQLVLTFDYGLEYGVFLEFANQGRYAIIAPAFDFFLGRFFADVEALIAA